MGKQDKDATTFARVSNSRMRRSAVFQGLKSIAAALHPQLPLNTKESQRLLTALTSSFRKHLDEVHPRLAGGEDGKHKPESSTVSTASTHTLHSSAALADMHLASVLTNPLLSRDVGTKREDQAYGDARVQLAKNLTQDPIALLETYREKGIASISIARLCLETFNQFLKGLPHEAQQEALNTTEPGRRVLLWLWQSRLYNTAACLDDRNFVKLLVPFLIKEGHERYLWEWIKTDTVLAGGCTRHQGLHEVYRCHRWKGRILQAMVEFKLGSPNLELKTADAALDTFFTASELKANGKESYMRFLPLDLAGGLLFRAFTKKTGNGKKAFDYERTDPALYERFIGVVELMNNHSSPYTEFKRAELWLNHPQTPSVQPILNCLVEMFSDPPDSAWQSIKDQLYKPKSDMVRDSWYFHLVEVASHLRAEGRDGDAKWLIDMTCRTFPKYAKYVDEDVSVRSQKGRKEPVSQDESPDFTAPRVPFPTFT